MTRALGAYVWPSVLVVLAVVLSGLRGVEILASGLLLGALAGLLAWTGSQRASVGLLAGALAQLVLVDPALAVAASGLLGVGFLALLAGDARLLVLGGLGALLPEPGAWLVPLASIGLLWAWGTGAWRVLGVPLAGVPIGMGSDPVAVMSALLAGLLAAEAGRRLADGQANLRNARLLVDLGFLLALLLSLGGLLAISVARPSAFATILRWVALTLSGGGILVLAHVGAAGGVRTRTRPRIWISLAWIAPAIAVGFGVHGDLVSLGPLLVAALALTAPSAGLGLRLLASRRDPGPSPVTREPVDSPEA